MWKVPQTPKAMSWTKQKGESGWRLRFVRSIGYYNKVLNFQNKACGASHTHALLFFVFQSIKQSIPSLQPNHMDRTKLNLVFA